MSEPLASSVSNRLERQIRRVLSLVLLLSIPELLANATAQRWFLNDLSMLVLLLLVLTTLATVISSWITQSRRIWFYLHGGVVALSIAFWPAMVDSTELMPQEQKPWIWWTMGIGILSIGVIGNRFAAALGLVGISAGWFLLHTSEFGGAVDSAEALQDSLYLFLFGGSIIGMITLVRIGANRADDENSKAIQSAIEQARIDAIERERQRLDALIHDKVLNTLLLAAKAQTAQECQNAAQLAAQAIESLKEAAEEPRPTPSVTPIGLFRALRRAATLISPTIEVRTLSGGAESLPSEKAQALTEATLQAIDNAVSHSNAERLELVLDTTESGGIQITVSDNGVGFRLDRITKDRIGLRTSVIGRMAAIGGEAKIDSTPGEGTKIVLRWPK